MTAFARCESGDSAGSRVADDRIVASLAVRAARRSARRALLAGAGPARGRRPASGKGLELRRARRAAAALRHRRDAGAARAPDRALRAARAWSRSATASTTAAARRGSPTPTATRCAALQRGRDWIWIAGNHDPDPADGIGGAFRGDARDRRADLPPRAEPARDGEIAGHLHPVARVVAARPRGQPPLLRRRRRRAW